MRGSLRRRSPTSKRVVRGIEPTNRGEASA
jgi:hypothetical protein